MKTSIYIFLFFSFTACCAQSPVIGLYEGDEYGVINNAYYKDTTDDLDKFVGTWLWQDGSTSWTIELRLLEQHLMQIPEDNISFYEDLLIGENIIVQNGQEVINTMNLFDSPFATDRLHNIVGNDILDQYGPPRCDDCDPSERRVQLFFRDPNFEYIENNIVIRHVQVGTNEELRIILRQSYVDPSGLPSKNAPTDISIPYGEYVLVKQ